MCGLCCCGGQAKNEFLKESCVTLYESVTIDAIGTLYVWSQHKIN